MPLEMPAVDVSTVPLLGAQGLAITKDSGSGLPPLSGNTPERINSVAIVLLVGTIVVALLGLCIGWVFRSTTACRNYRLAKRPPLWSILLLICSYMLLMPGLFATLFSFNIYIDFMHVIKMGVGPGAGINKFPGTTETMVGLIKMLSDTGSKTGALLVVIYAIVIPAVKLCLLCVGECGRHVAVKASRRSIQVLQNISKWACPDMFAYILLLHLVRGINHQPTLCAAGQLDVGFTCFSVFCLGSTVAAMGVHAPDREHGCFQRLAKLLGRRGLVALLAVLVPLFYALLIVGLMRPVMALRVVLEELYAPKGPIPANFAGLVNNLHIPEQANADVSFVACMQELLHSIGSGEVNSVLAFAMIAFFVVGCTALNVLVLSAAGVTLLVRESAHHFMPVSWVLKKLSMLDVALMGVVVVTMCMRIYQKDGVVVSMCEGMWWLAAAEVLHYFMYYTTKGTLELLEPKHARDSSSDDEETVKMSESQIDEDDGDEDFSEDSEGKE